MRTFKLLALGAALSGGLAACGDSTVEQSVLGAGAGAGVSAVAGGSVLTGAIVGAGANVAYCKLYPGKCS